LLPLIESFNRSDIENLNEESVIGVEINPDAKRKDILICSFDEMPDDWGNKFSILYSNSFDQSQDPYKTSKEMVRVCKKNALIILPFTDAQPTETDPVGDLTLDDLLGLFKGDLCYYEKKPGDYNYMILRVK